MLAHFSAFRLDLPASDHFQHSSRVFERVRDEGEHREAEGHRSLQLQPLVRSFPAF